MDMANSSISIGRSTSSRPCTPSITARQAWVEWWRPRGSHRRHPSDCVGDSVFIARVISVCWWHNAGWLVRQVDSSPKKKKKNGWISRCGYLHYRWFLLFWGWNLRMNISCGGYMFTNWFRRLTNFVSIAAHILPLHAEAKLSELIRAGMIRHAFISGWMSIER